VSILSIILVILGIYLFFGFLAARAYVWHHKGIETPATVERREVWDDQNGGYNWEYVDVPPVYIGPKECMIITAFGIFAFFAIVIVGGVIIAVEALTVFFNSKAFKNNRVVNTVFGLKG
jgi:hypothetical protein